MSVLARGNLTRIMAGLFLLVTLLPLAVFTLEQVARLCGIGHIGHGFRVIDGDVENFLGTPVEIVQADRPDRPRLAGVKVEDEFREVLGTGPEREMTLANSLLSLSSVPLVISKLLRTWRARIAARSAVRSDRAKDLSAKARMKEDGGENSEFELGEGEGFEGGD